MNCEWKMVSVQDLIDAQMIEEPKDGNHGNIHPKSTDYVTQGIPFIMANDLVNGRVDYQHCAYISEKQAKKLKKGFSRPGDVLLTHKATIGRTAIVTDDYETIILTPQVTYYRTKKGILNRYLKYYFDCAYFQNILANWAGAGSTRAYLGITAQKKLPILLPPLETQKKIAKILSALDDKIECNNQINKNLEEQLYVLYKEISFSKTYNYKTTTVDEFCNIFTGKKNANQFDENGQYMFFTCGEKTLKINSFIYDGPAIIISGNGSYTGRTLFYNGKFDLYQRTYACTLKPNIPKNYIFGLYGIIKFTLHEKIAGGTHGSSIPYIVMNDIAKFEFNLNEREFIIFSEQSKSILTLIQGFQNQNEKLKELRDTLLPKLMSGELDVSDIDI